MDKSDTPRTEQMIDSCGDYEKAYHYKGRFANFARGLEREVTALTAANADLTAQLAEARRDAERYQWLADNRFHHMAHPNGDGWGISDLIYGDDLDAAIDAAMKEPK